jgi:PTH1 family peptidyl-tRNA hydrolase
VALVLGLGNPGERYAATRHNVGWRVLDEIERRAHGKAGERHSLYRTTRVEFGARSVELMYPQTFMNASGEALAAWRQNHELDAAELLVIADDVYLPVGALRLRRAGSSGGHLGLTSIESTLGSQEYARLRIGVGAVDAERLREHVLESFEEGEQANVAEVIALAADAVECWALEGMTAAMNRFNRKVQSQEEPES